MGYRTHRARTEVKAMVFAVLLVSCLVLSIIMSMTSVQSLVLGTELNSDGTVEYLCLGTACENMTAMDW